MPRTRDVRISFETESLWLPFLDTAAIREVLRRFSSAAIDFIGFLPGEYVLQPKSM
jgi:hypothetical protein